MRISRSSGNAQASVAAAAGFIVLPVVLLATHGPATSATPSASKTASGRAPTAKTGRPPKIPGLSISVSDGRTTVQAGDRLTYTVSVRNNGTTRAPGLKITQTLPPGLKFISATRHGTVADGQVTWRAVIPTGGMDTFSVVAQVTQAPAGTLRLAAVACAAAQGSRPMVCAAHLDRLPAGAAAAPGARQAAAPSSRVPLMYGAACIAVLVAGALAASARRRGRVRRGLRRSS